MISTFLADLQDHRRPQGQRYKLEHIILFSIMAFLSNAKSYRDISRFIKTRFEVLKEDFGLTWEKPPGYTTIRNIIMGVDSEELEACFRAYTQSLLGEPNAGQIGSIAFDGKTLRGSYDHFQDKRAVQILSMFRTEDKIILAHEVIDQKTNEIPMVQKLLEDTGLEGYYYTMDALHCQKKTFGIAGEKDKLLIVQLKENQKELLGNCEDLVRFSQPTGRYGEENVEHGRIEKRKLTAYPNKGGFLEDQQWQSLIKTIYRVEREVLTFNTKTKGHDDSKETAYYVSNGRLDAQQAFSCIQRHWLVENSNHYVRDVSFLEDFSRIRVRADNMARLRSFALNIMRKNNVANIKGEMYENSLSHYSLYSYQHFL
jgi:predicted transposase YbfD/YdcC